MRLFVLLLGACSFGSHTIDATKCEGGARVCGTRCVPPGAACPLGMTVMASHIEGRGPGQTVLVVKTVAGGSPAAVAGLRPGDAIVSIDGLAPSEGNLVAALASEKTSPIEIQFLRQGFGRSTQVDRHLDF
jgi:C-terminal processing protease CtpA/Prc